MGLISDLIVRIKGDKTQLDSTLKSATGSVNSFGSTLKNIGKALIGVFAVGAIVNFTKEAMKLAAEAEGIQNAFSKIGDEGLLAGLKKATRGVMDESDLMRLAVKANNFKIPLQDLAKYLDFATKRAITTGRSVGDLSELIITGLGRKSSRSMIQLGLSATSVQESFKKAGGFMKLVTDETLRMGDVADTAGVRYERLSASVVNFKESWGGFVNNSKTIIGIVQWASDLLQLWSDKELGFWAKFAGNPDEYKALKAQQAEFKAGMEQMGVIGGTGGKWQGAWVTDTQAVEDSIGDLKTQLDEAKKSLDGFNASDKEGLQAQLKIIAALEERIKKLTTLNEVTGTANFKGVTKLQGKGMSTRGGLNSFGGEISPLKTIGDSGETLIPLADLTHATEKALTNFQELIKNAKQEAAASITDFVESSFSAMASGDWANFGKELLSGFASFLSAFGKQLILLGVGQMAFMKALSHPSPGSAALAIGAGIAMIAAAGTIRGLMAGASEDGVMSGSSGGGGGYSASNTQIKVVVEGRISGRDIVIAGRRYSDQLSNNT